MHARSSDGGSDRESDFDGDQLFLVGQDEGDHDSEANRDRDEDEGLIFCMHFSYSCNLSCSFPTQLLLSPTALEVTTQRQSERREYGLAVCTSRRRPARLHLT